MKKESVLDRFHGQLNTQRLRIQKGINRLSVIRLIFFLLLIIGLSFSFDGQLVLLARGFTFLTFLVFLWLMKTHESLFQKLELRKELLRQTKNDLARVRGNFEQLPLNLPEDLFHPNHPYAHDLDFPAENSILKLFGGTHHREAQRLMASWFNHHSDRKSIIQRQGAVEELSHAAKLRRHFLAYNRIHSKPDLSRDNINPWIQFMAPKLMTPLFILGVLLSFLSTGSLIATFFFSIPTPWGLLFSLQFILFIASAATLKQYILTYLSTAPVILSSGTNLLRFSKRTWQNKTLSDLKHEIGLDVQDLEKQVKTSEAIHQALATRSNGLAYLTLNLLFQWDIIYCYRLTRWKRQTDTLIGNWVHSLFTLEALFSLAHFAYLFPEFIFPRIQDSGTLHFKALSLGHPCIPEKDRVSNDYCLSGNGKMHLLTGSNMSGKSTFLRTVGLNWALALAGAPCCAEDLVCSNSPLWTSMRIQDSLAQGTSYFYAEVKRLKLILDSVSHRTDPTFFLLDEILKGTNSKERFLASQALVAFLNKNQASGMISTHDLELLKLINEGESNFSNYHFSEMIHDGKMSFDFKLKEGQLNSTNALKIIELAGLPLDFERI